MKGHPTEVDQPPMLRRLRAMVRCRRLSDFHEAVGCELPS
jgi:hypothetical protein